MKKTSRKVVIVGTGFVGTSIAYDYKKIRFNKGEDR